MRTRTKLLEMREQGWEMREKGLLFLGSFRFVSFVLLHAKAKY